MADVKELYEDITRQAPPQRDPLERQHGRQRRATRSRKVGAFAVAAVLLVLIAAVAVRADGPAPPVPLEDPPTVGPGLYLVDAATGTMTPVSTPAGGKHYAASPDGTRFAYAAMDASRTWQIFVVAVDGGAPLQVTHDPAGAGMPAWSSDGQRIAYSGTDASVRQQIFVVPADGGDATQVTTGPKEMAHPSWGRGDRSILADTQISDQKDSRVLRYGSDGGDPVVVVEDAAIPNESVDGVLAYAGFSEDCARTCGKVTIMEGGRATVIGPAFSWLAEWSPDGTRLAYVAGTYGMAEGQVHVYDMATERETEIVSQAVHLAGWAGPNSLLVQVF
jgi:dipeptidyl aminopeptidase/acylaminoacyl peptidase